MNDEIYFGGVALAFAGGLLIVLAWLIGVLGMVNLVNNYRAHPERYPDAKGLGRWMAATLAVGGLSFVACGFAVMTRAIGEADIGPWVIATTAWLVAGAFGGLARYRRMPSAEGTGTSVPSRTRRNAGR